MSPKRQRTGTTFAFVPAIPIDTSHNATHARTRTRTSTCPCRNSAPSTSTSTPTMKFSRVAPSTILGAAASALVLFSHPAASLALTEPQKLVAEVWRVVDKAYVDRTFNHHDWFSIRMKAVRRPYASVPDAYPAIRDMLSLLGDPYTRFLTPQQYSSLTSTATGELAGVGVEMFPALVDNNLTIASPLDESPAARAGIQPHDVIHFIDGEPVDGLTPDEAAARIRGEPGTTVMLTVVHDNNRTDSKVSDRSDAQEEVTLRLTRENLRVQTVTATPLVKGTLLVKIKQFNTTTASDVRNAVAAHTGTNRIILDLRNNPGGYFPGGVDVARLFIKAKTAIVYTVDKNGIEEETDSIVDGEFVKMPLVVLVNKGTASSSEILAGALKDNERAKLVGEKTFGKGVVQTVSQLNGGSGVAVTVARYETPAHHDINKIGIAPDVQSVCAVGDDVLSCFPPDVW